MLRKEMFEKEDLLCKAAKALELEEQQHKEELKKIMEERNNEKRMMESRIQELETVSWCVIETSGNLTYPICTGYNQRQSSMF
jgi:hypothetical protein